MNTQEAAALLGKSAWFVRKELRAGAIRGAFYGGTWNISEAAIADYINAHMNTPQPAAPGRRRNRRAF